MKCRKCGAENLDGAEYCNSCRAPLSQASDRPGAGRNQTGLWIGIAAAAIFAIVLVVLFTNGGGGGGGGAIGGDASPSASHSGLPQAQAEKAAVRDAEAFLKKNYPELLKAPRTVSTEDVGGSQVTTVSYAGSMKVQLSSGEVATIPQVVIVTRNARTGRTIYSVRD